MSDWAEMELGDVLTLQRGFDLPKRARNPGPYPVVSSSGVTGSHSEFKVAPPGVVIGRYGSLGSVHWVTEPFWPLNTSLWVKDFKGNNPRFVSLLLETVAVDGSAAAAVPGVNRNHLHKLPVRLPGPTTQRRVAAVLSAMDGLIEINERRVELLVRLVKLLYREWFELPNPLGSDGFSAFSVSDGGPIPEGWKRCRVGDMASVVTRGISPKYDDEGHWSVLNQRCIRDQRVSESAARRHEGNVPESKVVRDGDVLINSTGVGTLGRVGVVLGELYGTTVDSHVTIVRPESPSMNPWFAINMLNREVDLQAMGTGSTGQTELGRAAVAELPIVLPTEKALAEFADVALPILRLIPEFEHRSDSMKRSRDLLLPRLVSGQLDISDIDLGTLTPTEPE